MSHETQIGNLSGGISEEDSKLVDSILNDLNSHQNENSRQQMPQQQMPQQQMPQQQMPQQGQMQVPRDQNGNELTPEQVRQIQMQRQMAMQQQQLMAQQQQLAQQQKMAQEDKSEEKNIIPTNKNDIVENIKNESKSIILIMSLFILMNLEQIDNLFKLQANLFVQENGSLNMQAIFIKALIVGTIYYLVKSYLL